MNKCAPNGVTNAIDTVSPKQRNEIERGPDDVILPSHFLDVQCSEDTSTTLTDYLTSTQDVGVPLEDPPPFATCLLPQDDETCLNLIKRRRNKRVCPFCGLISESAADFEIHLIQHQKQIPYKCEFCNHGFLRDSTFRNHRCSKIPKVCQHCGVSFSLKKDLKLHLKEKHLNQVPKQMYCPHCDFSCWSSVNLNKHLRAHSSNKILNCPHCPFTFTKVESLQNHLKVHRNESSFFCPYCGAAFSKYGIVKIHMEVHKDAAVYECHYCEFKTAVKRNLSVHIWRAHKATKTHCCTICSYETPLYYRLKVHLLSHKGGSPKQYSCSSCTYTTNYSCNLNRHIASVHLTEKIYPCPSCDFKSGSLQALKVHSKRHLRKLRPPDFLKLS